FDDFRVTGHLIPDENRPMKGHASDRYRHGAAFGAAPCGCAACEIHLRQQPAAKDVAVRIGIGRHRNGAQRRLRFGWPIRRVGGGHGKSQRRGERVSRSSSRRNIGWGLRPASGFAGIANRSRLFRDRIYRGAAAPPGRGWEDHAMASDILTARKGPVLEITLNRPQIGNAASDAMAIELTKLLLGAAETSEIAVLRGAGDDFCVGRETMGKRPPGPPPQALE